MKVRFVVFALLSVVFGYMYQEYESSGYESLHLQDSRNITGEFLIASWNVQTYGDTKASNQTLVRDILRVVSLYDVLILQELRDKDGSAMSVLCDSLQGYTCYNSSRAGRGSSKEQYLVFVRDGVEIGGFVDLAQDESQYDFWERPPYMFWVSHGGSNVTILTSHIRPSDAELEIDALERLVAERFTFTASFLLMGDLNADCAYYDEENRDFTQWNWVIENSADTTVSQTDCAYDRIIATPSVSILQFGILKEGIYSRLSDHYPVWVDIGEV